MMATLLDLARLGVGGNAGDLRRLALGEERVALRLRLVAVHQLDELLALERNAFLERALQRLLDALGAGERRDQAAVALVGGSRSLGEDLRIGLRGGELGVVVAHALQRAVFGEHLLRKRLAGLRRIAFEQVVDEADLQALVALDRIAGDDHLHGLGRTDHARQALRAAGARQQAELHFRQAEVGVLGGDAEMAAQRGFETAAERIAVDRRDRPAAASSPAASRISCRPGACGGLPNSRMSAPEMKLRPAQASTIALMPASFFALASSSCRPTRTEWLSALTGGLSMVRTRIPSRFSAFTVSLTRLSRTVSHCGIEFHILTSWGKLRSVDCQRPQQLLVAG